MASRIEHQPSDGRPLSLDDYGEVLTVIETAALLRVGRTACYETIARKELPSFRVGRRLLIPKQGLLNLLARMGGNP